MATLTTTLRGIGFTNVKVADTDGQPILATDTTGGCNLACHHGEQLMAPVVQTKPRQKNKLHEENCYGSKAGGRTGPPALLSLAGAKVFFNW